MIIQPRNKNAPKINGSIFLVLYKIKRSFVARFVSYLPRTVLLGGDAKIKYFLDNKHLAIEVGLTY